LITKSITYVNDYGNGFEAVVGINAMGSRVDLDLNYIAGGEITDDSIGICMTAEAAFALADMLRDFAYKLNNDTGPTI